RRGDARQPVGHHRAVDPPAGGVAVRGPAAIGGRRPGGDVELEARDHGRAHCRPRRRPDQDGARPHPTAGRQGPRRAGDLPQPQRRLRGRRPPRRAVPGADGRPGRGGGLRPPERRGAHDHGDVEPWAAVIAGLVVIAIIFQSQNSNFLTAGNLVNLLVQGAAITLLGLGEVFALLLGEIDLSIGFVAGVAGVIAAELVAFPHNWPWWGAVGLALLVTAVIGLVQGTIITRLGLPSFVVTLAGLLGFQGVMLMMVGQGGTVPIASDVINDFANGNMTVGAGWVLTALLIVGYAGLTWWRDQRRRASGLVAPPVSLTVLKVAAVAVAGVALVLICNANRGLLVPIRGVPWVVLIV